MKILLHILVINILYAQNLKFSPELQYWYQSDSEKISKSNIPLHDFEIMVVGEYHFDDVYFLSRLGYHLINGEITTPSDFTYLQGLHHIEHSPGLGDNQRNYFIGDMRFAYGDSISYFYINKWDKKWGPGIRSLTISKKIPSFFHFGFNWKLNEQLHFEYFHGKLKSNITDINLSEYYDDNSSFEILRNVVGHRLDWLVGDKLILTASELVTYANRSLEVTYLLPFIPFFPLQGYVGEVDNIIVSGEIQYLPDKKSKIYGVLLMDEWTPTTTFSKDNHNWMGWQIGLEKFDLIFDDVFNLEYNWTDHRIYRHRYSVNDYYSYGYPIGFWAGPHAQEFYFDYILLLGKNTIKFMYSNAKRAELTNEMLEEQYCWPDNCDEEIVSTYDRFSGIMESKQVLKLSIERELYGNMHVNLSYTYVDWKNSGSIFNVSTSDLIINDTSDIIKHSLGLNIRYSY